jgi:hypothetical protein
MSRFDSSVSVELMRIEFMVYRHLGLPEHLVSMMEQTQFDTRVNGVFGTSARYKGTRKSGVANTSCGNTLIVLLSRLYLFHRENERTDSDEKWWALFHGDDCWAASDCQYTR